MRYYPSDLLVTVGEAEKELDGHPDSSLSAHLCGAGLGVLAGIFDADQLTEGLDEFFGGFSMYPWQCLTDTNDVYEVSPVGTVVLDDRRPGNTLRGLLLSWATGNGVVIRTRRQGFWTGIEGLLRRPGVPLPELSVVPQGDQVNGTLVEVPDVVLEPMDGHAHPALFSSHPHSRTLVVESRRPPCGSAPGDGGDVVPELLRLDCRADWTRRLVRRTYLRGSTISEARSGEDARTSGRLDAKFRYLAHRARRASYYCNLPVALGLAGLPGLDVLEKQDLAEHSAPRGRGMASGALPTGEVLRSGATTGDPRYIVYSRGDWNNMVREAIPLFYAMGLENGDRLINALYGGGMYGGLTTTLTEFTRMPIECYSMGQGIDVDSLLKLVRGFSVNALIGVPTLILPLLRAAYAQDPSLRLEKVLYLGTSMSDSDRAWLRDALGTRVVSSVLAANDGAQLGYQCTEMDGRMHHINDEYNYIEVVDHTGAPVPAGEAGELLITTLQKFEGPLIRYRVGDRGRVFDLDCACGSSGRVLEYHGRADGVIRVKGEVILHSEIQAELEAFGVSQLQAEVESEDGREILTLRTESPALLRPDEVRRHLSARLKVLSEKHIFDDGLDVFELRVECYGDGQMPRSEVSGKVRPVIDSRVSRG